MLKFHIKQHKDWLSGASFLEVKINVIQVQQKLYSPLLAHAKGLDLYIAYKLQRHVFNVNGFYACSACVLIGTLCML